MPMTPLTDKKTLTALKAKLRSRKKNIREEAGKAILDLGQQGIELLIEILEEERPKTRLLRLSHKLLAILMVWCIFAPAKSHDILRHCLQNLYAIFYVLRVFFTKGYECTRTQKECYELLTNGAEKQSIPYLLEALTTDTTTTIYKSALTPLLPQLVFEDIAKLHLLPKHRNIIHKQLSIHDRGFTIACLKALEQIGDETSIEPVLKFRNKVKDVSLLESCDTCLEYLRTNAERHTNAQTLLRASSIEAGNTNELLRPLASTPAEPNEELLRPSKREE